MSELYVGYHDRAPEGVARFLRPYLIALILGAVATAAAIVLALSPFSKAVFEFGTETTLEGVLELEPYPTLRVARPNSDEESRYLLVGFGKFGADELVGGFDGERVRVKGTLIYRDDQVMLETVEATRVGPGAPSRAASESFGRYTLVGEIVDSKCYLGVMKPGATKPHRACATRCISGGIPPLLLVRDAQGRATYYLLTDAAGGAVNAAVVERQLVAEPVRITGEIVRAGARLLLRADPEGYARVGSSG